MQVKEEGEILSSSNQDEEVKQGAQAEDNV